MPRDSIALARAGTGRFRRGRPLWVEILWNIVSLVIVRNPFQPSSRLRRLAFNAFGARVGKGVILRPGIRVKLPWKLTIGDDCWIGEDVWIHNQDQVDIEHDVVISQGAFITTGSHELRITMDLITRPIIIKRGAWVTSRCIVVGGITLHENAVATPGSVVTADLEADTVYRGNPARVLKPRWSEEYA